MHVDVPLLDRIYVTVKQARDLLGGVSHRRFYDMVNAGDVRIVKNGRRSLIPTACIIECSKNMEAAAKVEKVSR